MQKCSLGWGSDSRPGYGELVEPKNGEVGGWITWKGDFAKPVDKRIHAKNHKCPGKKQLKILKFADPTASSLKP